MKHIKEYENKEIEDLMGNLQEVGLGHRPEVKLDRYNFFEETQDFPQYSDVAGPGREISIDDLIAEFQERLNRIPKEDRSAASLAIVDLWTSKIQDLLKTR